MARPPSWKAIAQQLADRLVHHTYLCELHPDPDPTCAYCSDTLAHEAYLAKLASEQQQARP